MKAIVKRAPGPGIAMEQVAPPDVSIGSALLKVSAVGLCGSDIGIYTWKQSYHWLENRLPLIPGHEVAAQVVEAPAGARCKPGDRVVVRPWRPCGMCEWCRRGEIGQCPELTRTFLGVYRPGGLAEQLRVPAETCYRIPDGLPDDIAVLAEPLGVAGSAVEKASLQVGDRVVVFGPGPIGLLGALLALESGAEVAVAGVSSDAGRLAHAERIGAATFDIQSPDGLAALEKFGGKGFDAAFEFSGATSALLSAVDLVRPCGTVVLIGTHAQPCPMPVDKVIRRGLKLFGSYSTWDWEKLLPVLVKHRSLVGELVTHQFTMEEATMAFETAASRRGTKVLVRP